jgi:phosphate transport system protein
MPHAATKKRTSNDDRVLHELREILSRMGSEVRSTLRHAVEAAGAHDARRARVALARSPATGRLAEEADRLCLQILSRSRGRPAPAELKAIGTALKLVTTLARIEGLCAHLCRSVLESEERPSAEHQALLGDMGSRASAMVDAAVAAYLTHDPHLAELVFENHTVLKDDGEASFDDLLERLLRHELTTEAAARLHAITELVARIGEHATSLAELATGGGGGHESRETRRLAS